MPKSDIEFETCNFVASARQGQAVSMGRCRDKLAASTDPGYESRIQAALADVANGTHKDITPVAAKAHNVWTVLQFQRTVNFNLQVARQTLKDRSKGLHVSRREFAVSQQLLKPSEEEAIKDWLVHQCKAYPMYPRDLRARVVDITGKYPGQTLFEMYLTTRLAAAEAHCALAKHQISILNERLAKKRRQKSKRINARFVTHPELKDAFRTEEIKRIEKEKADSEKAAQGTAENDARLSQIEEDIKAKAFDGSLASYRCKDDLITIAGVLSLSRDGTVTELTTRIKEHLAANPDCTNQPRFVALLGNKRSNGASATMSIASTSTRSHLQNLPVPPEPSISSHQPGHSSPPHFMYTSHPPYFLTQSGPRNPGMYQYSPPAHLFPQHYFTQ